MNETNGVPQPGGTQPAPLRIPTPQTSAGQPAGQAQPGVPGQPGHPVTSEPDVVPGQRTVPAQGDTPIQGDVSGQYPFPSRRAVGAGEVPAETTGMRSRRLEHERRRVVRRRRRRRIRAFLILLLVTALLAGAVWYALYFLKQSEIERLASEDYPGPGNGQVEVVVETGDTGTDIGRKMIDVDVVKSLPAFKRAWDANKVANTVRPGTYKLKQQMKATDAIAALLDPANRSDNALSVTPGETVKQVFERFAQVTDLSNDAFTQAATKHAEIGLPAEAGGNLEGWLRPGSYEFRQGDTAESLIKQMVGQTVTLLDQLGVPQDQRQTVLIKASILEREVNIDQYRGKVARVIENRITQGTQGETAGLLQMDSTVLYGVGKSGGVPTAADLENDNPYNTYKHAGLPPTPIAAPSKASIEAVLNPEPGDWLYFVTVNLDTGETVFAKTYAEQKVNQERFRAFCRENEGRC